MKRVGLRVLMILLTGAAGLAGEPATQPAAAQRAISKDLFHVTDPPAPPWSIVDYRPEIDSLVYVTAGHDGEIQFLVLPKNAAIDPGIADSVAVAILKKLRADRTKAGMKMLLPAKSEKDSRFLIRIHEIYKVGEKTADELHLYNNVGPRVLMLTVNTVADDPKTVAAEHKAGEDLLLSTTYNRKAFRRDP